MTAEDVSQDTNIQKVAKSKPLVSALKQLENASDFLGLDRGTNEILKNQKRELTANLVLRKDDGTIEVIPSYRMQHNLSRGPGKGGIRFSSRVDLDDVRALAKWMTLEM